MGPCPRAVRKHSDHSVPPLIMLLSFGDEPPQWRSRCPRFATVPTVRLSHLSAEERRAYVLADNKLALNAGWNTEILAIELQALIDLEFDVTVTTWTL